MFGYDKFYIFSYSKGSITKIYDATKGNNNDKQELGYSEETNNIQLIRDLVTLQIEGQAATFKQEVSELDDPFELNRRCIKDFVMISLEQQSLDLSQSAVS